jgi:anti-sigma factor ChrR (cupin superfamily)
MPTTHPCVNGDLSVRATADTRIMAYSPSPSGTVFRKRMHLVGAPESGQVTSIVEYQPGATFPAHDHPEGEEILVLDGVFSDEHGDWPAGTYLLNPEGFRHAPFSKEGCTLFVKLRQFPGTERQHTVINHGAVTWEPTAIAGVSRKPLYQQDGFSDVTCLEWWDMGTTLPSYEHEEGAELFVLKGRFTDENGFYDEGSWLRMPKGSKHTPHTAEGCTLYIKRGGFAYLQEQAPA